MASGIINGHVLSVHDGHGGKTLIYIDNKLASDGKSLRPGKDINYWRRFLQNHPDFDAKCLLPTGPPWNTSPTFEELFGKKTEE